MTQQPIASIRHFFNTLGPAQQIALLVGLAILLAMRITYLQHGWVNDDSLLYFEAARLIADHQWQSAYQLFPWLLYPALLALGHLASGLDIHTTAQIINIALFASFSWGFALLILQAGGSVQTMWWGAILLFTTQYIVGDISGMLLRDEGFWACLTWAILFLLRFIQHTNTRDAYYFQIALFGAMLFRLEGIVYFLLPLALLIEHARPFHIRLSQMLHCISLPLCGAFLGFTALISGLIEINHLGRLQEIIYLLQHGLIERLQVIQGKADLMAKQILGHHLENFGLFSIWTVLIAITLDKTLRAAGWPVLFCLLIGRKAWKALSQQAKHIFSLQLILGFITSLLIIINVFVLSSRYVIASGIVMLVIGAFSAEYLYSRATKWIKCGLIMLLMAMLFANLQDSGRIDLDKAAVNYLQSINLKHQPVLYDTENARFYAHQPFMRRKPSEKLVKSLLESGKLLDYQYLMITITEEGGDYEQMIKQVLNPEFNQIHTLYGWKRKTKVLIYQKREVPAG